MKAVHQNLSTNKPDKYHVYFSTDSVYPPHWHEAIEIVYAYEDGIDIDVEGEIVTLYSGDIAIINSDDIHSFVQQSRPLKRLIVQIETAYYAPFEKVLLGKKFDKVLVRKIDDNGEDNQIYKKLSSHVLSLANEIDNYPPGYELEMESDITAILVCLLRHIPKKSSSIEKRRTNRQNRERLATVLQYVEDNYKNKISLQDIADISQFSTYHFTRFFKESIGLTFGQYLNRLRVAKSMILLSKTNDSIIDISYNVGFGSVKTFNRVFRIINDCSPSQFRHSKGF